ncbi:MAG: isocitrate lyase/PEP mutase family protein [Chloroflexi bacterium]|nr:isocitrate lyase/PEP mutase family protein [Chloroflexota bacterium]
MHEREQLRSRIEAGGPVFAPVCLDPLTARLLQSLDYEAAYLSGGALGFQLAVSEALLTLTELATVTHQITQRSSIPLIVDGGVGFGDPVHVSRAIRELEAAGAAAVELEDQIAPKRAHHHKGVEHLIPAQAMVEKIEAAVDARTDPDFLVIARTGAVRNESYDAAVERGRAYRDAGADLIMLFPAEPEQWTRAPHDIDAPLAAMGAFGARTREEWSTLGWPLVIDPFSGQVLAYGAMRDAHQRFQAQGDTGHETADLMVLYREIHLTAGMEELYAIEERTTEKPATD